MKDFYGSSDQFNFSSASPFEPFFSWNAAGSPQSNSGNDVFDVRKSKSLVEAGAGNDVVLVRANDVTVDAGRDNDVVVTFKDDAVVNGGSGNDVLLGGGRNDSLWGGAGNDVIRSGKGSDYALGGRGNDFTDTGEGLGIHFGGAGNDTFFIGHEIFGNKAKDTVIALDFGNGRDTLDIAPEILENIASVKGGKVDIAPVLAAYDAEGLGVAEVGQRLGDTAGGSSTFNEVASFLARFEPNSKGEILVDATTATTNEGDVIIALGITPDQLLAAIG